MKNARIYSGRTDFGPEPRRHHPASRKGPPGRGHVPGVLRVLRAAGAVLLALVTLAGLLVAGALVSSHDMHQPVPRGAADGTDRSTAATATAPARHAARPGRPLVVAFVAGTTGTVASDLLAPFDIFASSAVFHPIVVADHSGPVSLEGGPALVPTHTFREVDADPALRPDLVVVPALSEPAAQAEAPLRRWVTAQHQRGAKVLGVCAGALVLAETGMLDGLRATSHWSRIGALRDAHPAVHWVTGRRWVEDGSVTTTAAVSSGVPAALHVVADLAGEAEARRIADQHPELGWDPHTSTAIAQDHFAVTDWPVALDFVEPWWRPTVGIALRDGIDELDTTAAFEVYTQSGAARAIAVAAGRTVRTRHGLTLLTHTTADAPSLSRIVVPGTDDAAPQVRRLAESEDLTVDPLRRALHDGGAGARSGGGFTAALQNLADHSDGVTATSTAKMIGYPADGVDLQAGHARTRTVLLALASLTLAVLVGIAPTRISRRRRRRAATVSGSTA